MVSQIYTSEIKIKKIYIFKHNPNPNATPPLPHSFGPGIFALNSHTYNRLFEKILDLLLDIGLVWNLLTPRYGLLFLQDASKAKVTIPYLA